MTLLLQRQAQQAREFLAAKRTDASQPYALNLPPNMPRLGDISEAVEVEIGKAS